MNQNNKEEKYYQLFGAKTIEEAIKKGFRHITSKGDIDNVEIVYPYPTSQKIIEQMSEFILLELGDLNTFHRLMKRFADEPEKIKDIQEGEKYITGSDMANIKIFTKDMSCFFSNGYGDGINLVEVKSESPKDTKGFVGHFTVKNNKNGAYLSGDDCSNTKFHKFTRGRWWVHLVKPRHFIIYKQDDAVTA